jgi:GntR family transcriptional regulator, rspAB operon transcriptional repressor
MASTDIYRTMSEQIAQQLRNEILSGQLGEGEPLPGEKLAKRFSVSRGHIRDAVIQLTHQGLQVSEPNVRVKVAGGPNETTHRLVICVRRLIEKFALESVCEQLTGEDSRQLGEVLDRLRLACGRNDLLALVGHDMMFHRLLIERTSDPDLLAIWRPIGLCMMLRHSSHQSVMATYEDHRLIYEAVRPSSAG